MPWPQFSVAVWLGFTVVSGLYYAVRPRTEWVVLDPSRQRLVSGALAVAGISEAVLLLMGGFFTGVL